MAQGGIISSVIPADIDGSPNVILSGITCDSAVYVGAAIYLDGSSKAWNADASAEGTSNVLGLVESKQSSVLCTVRVLGVSGSNFSGLDTTKEYFLSDSVPGEITTTVPSTSGHIVLKLGQPYSTTEFLVFKGMRSKRA